MGGIGKFSSISEQRDFARTYQDAKKWHCECAVVYFLANEDSKFAAVASKKVGKAVTRNRAKRLLRAAFLDIKDELKSGIYILIAKQRINDMSYVEIEKKLKWAFRKIGSLK